MGGFQLHLITDRKHLRMPLEEAVERACRGGIDWVQLREKTAPAADVYAAAQTLLPLCRARGAGLLVNDRVDVVLAAGAGGVHLARKSLPVPAVKRILGPGRLLGVSVHSVEDARQAEREGADYVTYGHVFPTESKAGLPPRGIAALAAVVEAVDIPVLAIGGIGPHNVAEVLGTGCAGIAVISSILDAADPLEAAGRLRRAMDAARGRPRHPLAVPAAVGGGEPACT